ncbi:MAG: hypothetical protein JXB03_10815 [Spirochaetales bacterium]|nr:hypothetical protein [Spirochaetales bacterium]
MNHVNKLVIAGICIFAFASGCTTTKAIHEDPQAFAGERVVLSGMMSKRVPIPFTELAVFVFTDDYGSALVLSGKEHTLNEQILVQGTVAVFPEKGASREMSDFIASVSSFLVDNGWAGEDNAETVSKAVIKVFSAVMKGLGKIFIILES